MELLKSTEKYREFSLGHWEWIMQTQFGKDYESSINGGPKPFAVSMPPQCSFLVLDGESICVCSSRLDRALCHIFRSVCPWVSYLTHSVPNGQTSHEKSYLSSVSSVRRKIQCIHEVCYMKEF